MDNTRIDKILVTYEEPIVVQEIEEKDYHLLAYRFMSIVDI